MSALSRQPMPWLATDTVAVLMGGRSAEREISLMSGNGVLQALQSRGVKALAFDPAEQPLERLKSMQVSRVFIALHGRYGEDGTVQGALEWLGIPYTGSGVMASAIAMDKVMTKRLWRAVGLSTPDYVWLSPDQQTPEQIAQVPDRLGLPFIVKPPREGSSIGVTKVSAREQLAAAVDTSMFPDGIVPAALPGRRLGGRVRTSRR